LLKRILTVLVLVVFSLLILVCLSPVSSQCQMETGCAELWTAGSVNYHPIQSTFFVFVLSFFVEITSFSSIKIAENVRRTFYRPNSYFSAPLYLSNQVFRL
jgi:hypothetical protein